MTPSSNPSAALEPALAALLGMQQKVANAPTLEAFHFTVVNEILYLVSYRQAVLWRAKPRNGHLDALSGVPVIQRDAPYVQWLNTLLRHLASQNPHTMASLTPEDIPHELRSDWTQWLPEHALWIPMVLPKEETEIQPGVLIGGLLLARENPWSEAEHMLLSQLSLIMTPVWWSLLARRHSWWRLWEKRSINARWWVVLLLLASLFLPVTQTVLAPAEVVPLNPSQVRAAIEGVVSEFHVLPNETVVKGQPLFTLDATALNNRLRMTQNELEVARAEHRQGVQHALRNPEDEAKVAVIKGRVEQRLAELEFLEQQRQRVGVVADRDGVVIFGDQNDWIGRPVVTGERVMMLADPKQVKVEMHLPVADAISLESGTFIELFLTIDPNRTYEATLLYAGYRAEMTTEGILAYRIMAKLSENQPLPRLGLRGTAKIHGQKVRLYYYLFRRPLAKARQLLGW